MYGCQIVRNLYRYRKITEGEKHIYKGYDNTHTHTINKMLLLIKCKTTTFVVSFSDGEKSLPKPQDYKGLMTEPTHVKRFNLTKYISHH